MRNPPAEQPRGGLERRSYSPLGNVVGPKRVTSSMNRGGGLCSVAANCCTGKSPSDTANTLTMLLAPVDAVTKALFAARLLGCSGPSSVTHFCVTFLDSSAVSLKQRLLNKIGEVDFVVQSIRGCPPAIAVQRSLRYLVHNFLRLGGLPKVPVYAGECVLSVP
jgi:hypothetical protein